jgi:hypothetical protein
MNNYTSKLALPPQGEGAVMAGREGADPLGKLGMSPATCSLIDEIRHVQSGMAVCSSDRTLLCALPVGGCSYT